MRVVCVWREGEDYSRTVEEWLTDFERRTGKRIESLSPDGREGAQFCATYDIVEYPTMVVLGDDGAVLEMWRGASMPLFDQVSYYAV